MMIPSYLGHRPLGILDEITRSTTQKFGKRPLSRKREAKDAYNKKKAAKKIARASRRRNRR